MEDRKFDILLWGATGFTGRCCANHLATRLTTKWAIGGRNESKLKEIRENLIKEFRGFGLEENLEILIGDINSPESLDSIISQTKVVVSTAGPFDKIGFPIVEACVRNKTHYCDSTGEPQFIKKCIDKLDDEAKKNQVCVINCCGFDSIPSDLGTLGLIKHVEDNLNQKCGAVRCYTSASGAGVSGGTIASVAAIFSDSKLQKELSNPNLLHPPEKPKVNALPEIHFPKYNKEDSIWASAWIMAGINTKIVRRSAAFIGYGENFAYGEYSGSKSYFGSLINSLVITTLLLAMVFPPTRYLITRMTAGKGPSKEQMDKATFRLDFRTVTEGDNPQNVALSLRGSGDPGYKVTGKMLGESAIFLAQENDNLEVNSGVITPATAFGTKFLPKLTNHCDISIKITP